MKKKTIIGMVALLLLVGGTIFALKQDNNGGSDVDVIDKETKWNVEIDENAGEIKETDFKAIQEELDKKIAETSINISMNTNPVFENGKSEGNLLITNDDMNVYMQVVEIVRDDTQEIIYTSKAIPVGKRIETAKLDVELPQGVYACTAYFNAIRDNGDYVGKAAAKITINILN